MYFFLIFFGFLAAEFFVIAQVGGWLGGWATFGLLALGVLVGGFLLNLQNARNSMLRGSALGGNDILFRLLAGLLFIFPGFISDALALLLLLPPVRLLLLAVAGHYLTNRLMSRMGSFRFVRFNQTDFPGDGRDFFNGTGERGGAGESGGFGGQDTDDTVIEGEFRDVTEEMRRKEEGASGAIGCAPESERNRTDENADK